MTYNYNKLWKLLIDKGMTKTELRVQAGISTNILAKMGKNESVALESLAKICVALKCTLDEVVEIVSDEAASNPTISRSDEAIQNRQSFQNNYEQLELSFSHNKKKSNKPKVISLFSGAGGLDIGFEQAGFSIAVAVEMDPSCCDTLKTNRPDLPIINGNITDITGTEILSKAGLKPLEAALVIGGPPCQSFSLAGLRKGLEDDRGKLLFEYVRVVRETLPVGFVLENVKGLTNWDSGRALKLLIEELSKPIEFEGKTYVYTITPPKVLNAVDYGVPQYRERLILVGNRKGLTFEYPKPCDEKERKTVWDAIGGLPAPEQPSETALRVAGTIKGRREKFGF